MGTKYNAKYVVTLTSQERKELLDLVGKGKAAAYKIKHANILLASDENGGNLPAAGVTSSNRLIRDAGDGYLRVGRPPQ